MKEEQRIKFGDGYIQLPIDHLVIENPDRCVNGGPHVIVPEAIIVNGEVELVDPPFCMLCNRILLR